MLLLNILFKQKNTLTHYILNILNILIHYLKFCKMVYTIEFLVKKTLISSIYTKTVSSIISEIFDKIYSAPPISRVVFTPLTSKIAEKITYESNIFFRATFMPNK